jgi:hypothetical protein
MPFHHARKPFSLIHGAQVFSLDVFDERDLIGIAFGDDRRDGGLPEMLVRAIPALAGNDHKAVAVGGITEMG